MNPFLPFPIFGSGSGQSNPVVSGNSRPGNSLTSTQAGQWYLNGAPVVGQTGSSILIPYTVAPGDLYTQLGSNAVAVSAYDTDASTWFAAIVSNGGTQTPAGYTAQATKWYHDEFFREIKGTSGLWSAILDMGILSCVGDLAAAKVKIKDGTGGTSPLLVASGTAPTFTATGDGAGAKGNGTSSRLATGLPITAGSNSLIMLRQPYTSAAGAGYSMSTSPATGDVTMGLNQSMNVSAFQSSLSYGSRGVYAVDYNAGAAFIYQHGSPYESTSAAFGDGQVDLMGGRRINGTYYYSNIGIAMYAVGTHLTQPQHLALALAMERLAAKFGATLTGIMACLGDSITKGEAPTSQFTDRWTKLVSTTAGKREMNFGIPGNKVRGLGTTIHSRRADLAPWSPEWVTIMGGTNDCTVDTATASQQADFQLCMEQIVDAAIAATGNVRKVVLCSIPWRRSDQPAATLSCTTAYNIIIANVAANKGVRFADVWTAHSAGGGDSLMADALHQNTAGHAITANTVTAAMSGP